MRMIIKVLFYIAAMLPWANTSPVQAQSEVIDVALYLDASYSMEGRNMAVEMEYLEQFFGTNQQAQVELVTFSNAILERKSFVVKDGDWSDIAATLITTSYDGATAFDILDFSKKTDYYLLLTDGNSVYNDFPKTASAPVIILNSIAVKDALAMKLLAAETGGSYNMLKSISKSKGAQKTVVRGRVTTQEDGEIVYLEGARVQLQGSGQSITTAKDGTFSIAALPGDIIVVTHLGKKPTQKRVVRGKPINVFLPFDGDALDEVVLTAKAEPEDEQIYIGNEKKSKKKITYAVQSIGEEDISPIDVDVKQTVKGQFSNLEIANDAATKRVDLTQFLGRHKNMTILGDQYGLVVIDGVATAKASSASGTETFASTLNIDPNNIADITYLKGLTATNRYGSLGKNGVILITTKAYATRGTKDLSTKQTLGTTSFYNKESVELDALPDVAYINEIKVAQDIDTAYENYLLQRDFYGDEVAFYIDVATYFKGWGDQLMITRILSNVVENFIDQPEALHTAAFKYQELGNPLQAIQTLRLLTNNFPNYLQATRDLALLQADMGAIEEAKDQYLNLIADCQQLGPFASSFVDSVTKEFRNFVSKNKAALDLSDIPPQYTKTPEQLTRRIVVSWNDPQALFDLQIVNPQNRFFTWNHTLRDAGPRLLQEQKHGFKMEEFFLTSGDVGTWKFNVINYGFSSNDKGQPTYLRLTVYENYGTAAESKTVSIVRLSEIDKAFTVLNVTI